MANRTTLTRIATDVAAREATESALRAVDYLRVSTEQQTQGFGITKSQRSTTRHIKRKGWKHVETFSDPGISGSLEMGSRPDFDRLMELASELPRPFDVVVVEEGRAIGRTGRAFWRWVWALEDMGIFVSIVDGDIDNTTPEGRREMRRQADYAETEWETIRGRTQGGLQEKAESEGSPHIGGRPPFGYEIRDQGKIGLSRLAINEKEAEIVRLVHSLIVAEGKSFGFAAATLNSKKGMATRSGKPWTSANLRNRIMSDPILDGQLVFRGKHAKSDTTGNPVWGERVAIPLPRILSENEAEALRDAAAARSWKRSREQAIYPLSKRLIGLCKSHYHGLGRESVGLGRAYRCNGHSEKAVINGSTCSCSYIDADAVETRVWQEVVKLLGNAKKLEEAAAEWVGMTKGNEEVHKERIADLDQQISKLNSAISAVVVATAKETAGQEGAPEAIRQATAALNEELARLRRMRDEAAAWFEERLEADQRARDLQALAKRARTELPKMQPQDQADFIDLLDLKVIIDGPVPQRTGGVPCPVRAWYEKAGADIPSSDLSDQEWASIASLLPTGRRGSVRRSVDAIHHKARSGDSWNALPSSYGSSSTAAKHFLDWVQDGTWDAVNRALNTTRVPLAPVELLPPMHLECRFDPRVMVNPEEQSRTES